MKNAMMIGFVSILVATLGCQIDVEDPMQNPGYGETDDDDDTTGDDDSSDLLGDAYPEALEYDLGDDDTEEGCEFEYTYWSSSFGDKLLCDGPLPVVNELYQDDLVQVGNSDGMWYVSATDRHAFPTAVEFESWYGPEPCPGCEGVVLTDQDTLTGIPLNRNVTVKPGSTILYSTASGRYWVVDTCHTVRWVTDPAFLEVIYGQDWSDLVYEINEALFVDYTIEASIYDPAEYDLAGALARTLEEELTCPVGNPTMLTVTLASGTPSGAAVPGFGEVFRFNANAHAVGEVSLQSVPFSVNSTDNDGSDWNTCANLADPVKWQLVDYSDPATPIGEYWEFRTKDDVNVACADDPNAELGYVLVTFWYGGETIPAGNANTYSLYMDTSGASSAYDDSIRIDMDWELGLLWYDYLGTGHNGVGVPNLPINGGTQVF